jgi:hypothetical protein
MVIIFRMTATIMTFDFFPAARRGLRQSWSQ